MQNLKILNKKEIKNIFSLIEKQFGCKTNLDYVFLINKKNKIYVVNKEVFDFDLTKLKINSLGLYFAQLKDNEIRFSIEGSQIIGPKAKKNVVELNEKEARNWLKGFDLDKKTKNNGFVIIKHKNDFLGCGKQVKEKILNYVPKNRRLMASD